MAALKVGIAKQDITPPFGTRLLGYGVPERPAEEIHDPLYATALVFQQGDTIAAHVTLDLSQVDEDDIVTIREKAAEASGIAADHINIGVIHTHSGPQTVTFEGWGDKDESYIQQLVPAAAKAVAEARDKLVPVKVGFGTTETKVGVNRRGVSREGHVGFGDNEYATHDSIMTVVRFDGADGPVATLIHCSAHATAMGCNRLISRDWPGVMIERFESQIHAPAIFINGAYGDSGPRTNQLIGPAIFSAGTGDGIHAVNEVGYRGATDSLRTHQAIKELRDDCELEVLVEEMQLPLAPLPSMEEATEMLAKWEDRKDQWGEGICNYRYWQRVIEAHNHPSPTHRPFVQTIIKLGPLALVPMPGEPFSSTTMRMRKFSPFQYTIACGGTNGMLCYLPDRESRHRGGYETWVSIGTLTHLMADTLDDVLVEENLKMLDKLA